MTCGIGDQAEFEAWRDRDPRNAAAFARMLGTAATIRRARPGLRHLSRSASSVPTGRRQFMQTAAAYVGAIALGGGAFAYLNGRRASAKTPVGGFQQLALPDGGQLTINTDSTVEWRFDKRERAVWLKKGEIALAVAASVVPLCLYAGERRVVLEEGKINARIRNGALDLLVLDGAARVRGTGQAVNVVAGEAILAGRTRVMTQADMRFVSAWQQGQVYFNGETLGAAVDEYNRYLTKKITIGDPSIQGIRLGGRFNTHDPADFLTSLHGAFGIISTRTADGSIILTK
jgi:transmembrane sensor